MIKKRLKGFTLIEMMVSITVFLIIALSVMGLVGVMFRSQQKAQSEQDFVTNLSESLFSLKNYLRPFTGFQAVDIKNAENYSDGDNCASKNLSETIAMFDQSQNAYYLTTQRTSVNVAATANQSAYTLDSVRLILTTQEAIDNGDATAGKIVLPLIKDFTVRSVCFKAIGTDVALGQVHPRVTAVIKARTISPIPEKVKTYTFQFTLESRNTIDIQNVYNNIWGN